MSYCPRWVFEAGCAASGSVYLNKNLDLNTIANSCAAVLSEFMARFTQEVAAVIESMVRFWMS